MHHCGTHILATIIFGIGSVLSVAVLIAAAAPKVGQVANLPGQVANLPHVARHQAVWVDAFHEGFKSPRETRRLIEWARTNHVNTLFIEVRKAGDAYYKSKHEPLAPEIAPGYDPLADLLAQAHAPGKPRIEIHAWLIVYRVATTGRLPAGHVATRHPEWINLTNTGRRGDGDGGIYLDPGVPGVIDHTDLVVSDLASKYDLDGIHFDRIRYPGREWGYNPTAIARYQKQTGRVGRPSPDDAAWKQFRREQIDAMLQRLYLRAKSVRPSIKVSAATIAFDECPSDFQRSLAYDQVFQNWLKWAATGWLDLNCLMAYKREGVAKQAAQYRDWIGFLSVNRGLALPLVGQGSFINGPTESMRQVSLALRHPQIFGVSLYSYSQLAKRTADGQLVASKLRNGVFRPNVPAPALSPEQARLGWVGGQVTGGKADRLPVVLATAPARRAWTDGSGFFSFNRVPPGEYQIAVEQPRGPQAWQTIRVAGGHVSGIRLAGPSLPPATAELARK